VNRSRARQWSRTALALAALFGSFPIVGRLVLGEWAFEGATGIACLWLAIGVYLHVRARRMKSMPDPALVLDEALQFAALGDTRRAMATLDRAIRESPWFWQAFQCRGELSLRIGAIGDALDDFAEAIRLAPNEPHLRQLHAQAEALLHEI
jgi:tetratricopeptide (TPR) repeat protein